MGNVSVQENNDEMVRFFHRHVIPIHLLFRKGSEEKACLITTFVMSIYDQWFLVTAGHCIEDIEENLINGYEIARCRLIDFMGSGARHAEPIPFDYQESSASKLCYDPKYDYGILYLNENQVRLLKANGIQALNEEVWEKQPDSVDFYMLLGVVNELSDVTPNSAHITSTLHKVIELPDRPADFGETEAPTFWGRIHLKDPVTDIAGMSGGPIFSIHRKENGDLRYWLHAIQSRWLPSQKLIAACLARPVGIFLKEVMEGKHQHLLNDE